jgi:hypothetical protein
LLAREDPEKLETTSVRFLGRAFLERSFITLADAQLLVACLAQLERADENRGRASRPRYGGSGSSGPRGGSGARSSRLVAGLIKRPQSGRGTNAGDVFRHGSNNIGITRIR